MMIILTYVQNEAHTSPSQAVKLQEIQKLMLQFLASMMRSVVVTLKL